MIRVKHDLLTSKFTDVYCEDISEQKFGAPHHFKVFSNRELSQIDPGYNCVGEINFQEGPCLEKGVNGVANEDVLIMVLKRLEGFQATEYKCRENAIAITKIEEALLWLRKRTMGREISGKVGTSKI